MALAPQYKTSVAPLPGANNATGNPNSPGVGAPDALGIMKQMMKQSGAQVNYDPVYHNIYEDKTLAEFKAQSGENSEESNAYFKSHASAYMVQFVQECKIYRHGMMHSTFKDLVENFHALNQVNSQVKREYTQFLLSRIDLLDVVALRTSFWFGFLVANILRNSNNGTPPRQQILNAAQTATINILNIEIVLWMNGAHKGKQFLFNPTPDVAELMAVFNKRRQVASTVFQFFDEQSPYDSANFMDNNNLDGSAQSILPELAAFNVRQRINPVKDLGLNNIDGSYVPDFLETTTEEQRELMMIPFQNLRNRSAYADINTPPAPQHSPDMYNDYEGYSTPSNTYRTDISNITKGNRHQFDIRRFFNPTGLEHWFTIAEDDWLFIRGVLKRSPKQRMEESLVRDCKRLVHYNFDNESEYGGWTSRSIRFKGIDADMILSDPSKLLPLLTDPGFDPETSVKVMDAKEFFDEEGKKLGPDAKVFDALREPGFEYRIIKSDEELESDNTAKVMERLYVMGHTLTSETHQASAIFNDFDITGRMLVTSKYKRDTIAKRFPFLFFGNDSLDDHSYFSALNEIKKAFQRGSVDDDTVETNDRFDVFVERRLTTDFNNWLINACGYAVKSEDGAQLNVDNIFDDLEELKKVLLTQDKEVYDSLNQIGRCNHLLEQMKLFDPISETPEGLSPVAAAEYELSLYRRRKYSGIIICNQPGPKPIKNKTIILRRSVHPEFFLLLDELKKDLPTKGRSIESENILLMYKNTNDLFMVTQTVYDDNVVTIRNIVPMRTLLNPAFG